MAKNLEPFKPPIGMPQNRGAGMFPTKLGKSAAKRAFRAIRPALERSCFKLSTDKYMIRVLRKAGSEYFHDISYYNETLAAGNKELKPVYDSTENLIRHLNRISYQARYAIERHVQFRMGNQDARGFVAGLLPTLKHIAAACEASLLIKGRKQKSFALRDCCNRLWELRETITDRAFIRSFDLAKGPGGKDVFTSPDALFVQTAMEAIDSKVPVKSIKTQLQIISEAVSSLK